MTLRRGPKHQVSQATGSSSRTGQATGMMSRVIAGFALTAALIGVCWYFLTGTKVEWSEKGYELSKALYATCNLQDTRRLDAFVKAMDQHSPSPEELAKLKPIVELAQRGDWEVATDQARKLMNSQNNP